MNYKHGKAGTRTHRIWAGMKWRCLNPSYHLYHRYGGRGIKVCERWMDFANFLSDMGEAPPGMSIDRINNDGDYEPGNCRWATQLQQSRNMSRNKPIEFNGQTKLVGDWEREYGLRQGMIYKRLKRGWSIEKAITTPSMPQHEIPLHAIKSRWANRRDQA